MGMNLTLFIKKPLTFTSSMVSRSLIESFLIWYGKDFPILGFQKMIKY